jgi:hypothetical protein
LIADYEPCTKWNSDCWLFQATFITTNTVNSSSVSFYYYSCIVLRVVYSKPTFEETTTNTHTQYIRQMSASVLCLSMSYVKCWLKHYHLHSLTMCFHGNWPRPHNCIIQPTCDTHPIRTSRTPSYKEPKGGGHQKGLWTLVNVQEMIHPMRKTKCTLKHSRAFSVCGIRMKREDDRELSGVPVGCGCEVTSEWTTESPWVRHNGEVVYESAQNSPKRNYSVTGTWDWQLPKTSEEHNWWQTVG